MLHEFLLSELHGVVLSYLSNESRTIGCRHSMIVRCYVIQEVIKVCICPDDTVAQVIYRLDQKRNGSFARYDNDITSSQLWFNDYDLPHSKIIKECAGVQDGCFIIVV